MTRRKRIRPAAPEKPRGRRKGTGPNLFFLLLLSFSLFMICAILGRSARTRRTYQQAAQLHASYQDHPIEMTVFGPMATPVPVQNEAPQAPARPVLAETAETAEPAQPALAKQAQSQAGFSDAIPELFHLNSGTILGDMAAPYAQNPDLVAWLTIPGTLDLPILYRDNTYYLTHDFTGQSNASGALFLDESHPLTSGTQNLLIHGHNMRDGTMFGRLTQYRSLPYLKAHPIFRFSTLYEEEEYAVFAVIRMPLDPADANFFNYYAYSRFHSLSDFSAFARTVRGHSLYQIPVDLAPSDALLTLSTCLDTEHLLVMARRLRPGESADALSAQVMSTRT